MAMGETKFCILAADGRMGGIARDLADAEAVSSPSASQAGIPHFIVSRTERAGRGDKRRFYVAMQSAHGLDAASFADAVATLNNTNPNEFWIIKES